MKKQTVFCPIQVTDCPPTSRDYYARDYSSPNHDQPATTLTLAEPYKAIDLVDGGKVYADLDAVRDDEDHMRHHQGNYFFLKKRSFKVGTKILFHHQHQSHAPLLSFVVLTTI